MHKFEDRGFVLAARRHGETAVILTVFTSNNGKHLGMIRGKKHPIPGSFVNVKWQARLSEHLGTFAYEEESAFSAGFLNDPERLAGISSLCALLDELLPEREPYSVFYEKLQAFTYAMERDDWVKYYIQLELALLSTIGFGLDLSKCAGGGDPKNLAYVSPNTGRAVSLEMGRPYHEKLLILPRFLWDEAAHPTKEDLKNGLILTGYFLGQHIQKMPLSRKRIL